MTPETAQEYACCGPYPAGVDVGPFRICRGPLCAGWRWAHGRRQKFIEADERDAIEPEERPEGVSESWTWLEWSGDPDDHAGWLEPADEAGRRRQGYCGLGGPPGPGGGE